MSACHGYEYDNVNQWYMRLYINSTSANGACTAVILL